VNLKREKEWSNDLVMIYTNYKGDGINKKLSGGWKDQWLWLLNLKVSKSVGYMYSLDKLQAVFYVFGYTFPLIIFNSTKYWMQNKLKQPKIF